ncbi:MAG: divalent-cation tolerance protein CutA [Mariprofundus sp.]
MPEISIIHSSVASQRDAVQLADALIGERLAACVQIHGPGTSIYHWQGEVEHGCEWYLTIKTPTTVCHRTLAWLESHHPYETPEIIWSTFQCSAAYAQWATDAAL